MLLNRVPRCINNSVKRALEPFDMRFFSQGAQHHHAPSMLYLGKMCLFGRGVPVDYDMALLWFEKAATEVKFYSLDMAFVWDFW